MDAESNDLSLLLGSHFGGILFFYEVADIFEDLDIGSGRFFQELRCLISMRDEYAPELITFFEEVDERIVVSVTSDEICR
jgi:hypothetical protein